MERLIKQLIILQCESQEDALSKAFKIVGEDEFELISNFTETKMLLDFTKETKWIIIENTRNLHLCWKIYKNGTCNRNGDLLDVNIIFIEKND